MLINGLPVNAEPVNGFTAGSTFSEIGAGQLIGFEQVVARIGAGQVMEFEQTVNLRLSSGAAANFIEFEQIVATISDGAIFEIEQRVVPIVDSIPSHLTRTGWDLDLMVGGYLIPNSQIYGDVDITRGENDAALMSVTLQPPTGVQGLENYHGKSVTLDIRTANGTNRLYTGIVDIPEIDMYEEKITLRCTDRRTEQLNSQLRSVVQTIGVYSEHIFSEPKDVAEEIEQRLTTTPHAIDFNAYGNYTVTPWAPKSVADFTLTDSDIYRESPRVELTSRGRVTNKVNISMQYRFERFYHHEKSFSWESPIATNFCNVLQLGFSLTQRDMVQSAAEAAGWPIKSRINFTDILPSGWYRCNGITIGWSTVNLQGETVAVVDENGNQVSDSNGNALFTTTLTGGTDNAKLFCMGASWTGTTQWSQSVTETYTLSLQAPQSIAQFGTITEDLSYSVDEEADTSQWEDYTSYRTVPGYNGNYYIDQDIKRNEFRTAVDVALRQARNTILGSHRDTRVTVDTFIWPEVDLTHTVLIDCTEIEAKGKVFTINHRLNINTGEAITTTTIVLSRSQGSASSSALTIPSKPVDSVTIVATPIRLGNHYGEDPTTASAASWTGMIGNRWKTENNNTFKTTYQEQFIVDTPAVPSGLRDARELTRTASYNVVIPNDTLSISFNGKA